MKKLLFLFTAVILFSCSKDKKETPSEPTGFSIIVKQNSIVSGHVVENDANCLIMVWKADGKDFDLSNISDGYAIDKNTDKAVKFNYGTSVNVMSEKVPAGHYLAFVQRTNTGDYGRLAYSYTYFDVSENNYNEMKKVFTTHVIDGRFELWNQPE